MRFFFCSGFSFGMIFLAYTHFCCFCFPFGARNSARYCTISRSLLSRLSLDWERQRGEISWLAADDKLVNWLESRNADWVQLSAAYTQLLYWYHCHLVKLLAGRVCLSLKSMYHELASSVNSAAGWYLGLKLRESKTPFMPNYLFSCGTVGP